MFLIYVGRCLPTNKVYVGKSVQGKRRPLSHVRDLNYNRHSNKYLQHAWNKYGENSFTWHIVEECSETELQAKEQWWIEFLRATDRRYGFNLCNAVEQNSGLRSVLAQTQVERWRDPEIRSKRLVGLKALHKNPDWKSRRAEALAKRWADPQWRAKMLKVLATNGTKLSERMASEPGFKQYRMRGIQPTKFTGRV